MRIIFGIVFVCIIFGLGLGTLAARRSKKPIAPSVAFFCMSIIPPVLGNLVIVLSPIKGASLGGSYIYFIGMDVLIYALLNYAMKYCGLRWSNRILRGIMDFLLVTDVVQFLLNPFFGHAFDLEPIQVDGFTYWRLVPHLGQTFHRAVVYSILLAVIIIFIFKIARTPRINAERYVVILLVLLVAAVWQTVYIFLRIPVDSSMIGFGVVGLLVFYFSLYYRPMRLLDRMLANIASGMHEALFFFDANDRCIWANQPGIELCGIEGEAFDKVKVRLAEIFGGINLDSGEWTSKRVLGTGDDAEYYVLEMHAVTDDRERVAGSFLSIRDNTEEQRRLKREMYNATHDTLTGIYTKEYLFERIREMLEQNPDTEYQVIFVDIKNFKIVNDVFGSAFGDFALQHIAAWLRSNLDSSCLFGRLGGDTFGVFEPCERFNRDRMEEVLANFKVVDGTIEYHVLIHLGIYRIIRRDVDISVMFDRAHLALSTIRDEYQTHIAFYDDEIRSKMLWDQHISSQLHDAIASRQLRPYLQPIVDPDGKVVGAEALVRWIHPEDGFLSPGMFIPVFEKNGMIVEVDKHMWRSACEILAKWKEQNIDLFISVNISPKDFYFFDVNEEIMRLVEEYQIDPAKLRIEITETVMMTQSDERMKILSRFREAGFIVEMDDFGSGYSSLNMLKDMPVDVLKIDMKFLSKSKDEQRAHTIVQNIIKLSDDLGIASLTEGVETEGQYHALTEMQCKLFQGYYFSKPIPVEDFEKHYVK